MENQDSSTGHGPQKTGKRKLIIIIILIVAIIAGGFYFFGESLGLKGSIRMKEKGSTEMRSIKSTIKTNTKTN